LRAADRSLVLNAPTIVCAMLVRQRQSAKVRVTHAIAPGAARVTGG